MVRESNERTHGRTSEASAKVTSERRPLPLSLPLSLRTVPFSAESLLRVTEYVKSSSVELKTSALVVVEVPGSASRGSLAAHAVGPLRALCRAR